MKISELLKEVSLGTLASHLLDLYNSGGGNTRLRGYIESHGLKAFEQKVRRFEMYSDKTTLSRVANKPVSIIQLIDNMESVRELPSVGLNTVRNTGSELKDTGSPLVGDDGIPPKFLFRYISDEEYQSIKYSGYMSPSEFYNRIHASYRPEGRYKVSGGVLISIRYDRTDGWSSKQAGDNVYAVTGSRVSSDKIKIVR